MEKAHFATVLVEAHDGLLEAIDDDTILDARDADLTDVRAAADGAEVPLSRLLECAAALLEAAEENGYADTVG